MGGKKKKRDFTEDEELFIRALMEHFEIDARDYEDALELDARELEFEDLDMRDIEELEFEARELEFDSENYERDLDWESYEAYVLPFLPNAFIC